MVSLFRKSGTHLALAIGLMTGAAVAAIGIAEPAHAQKKDKKGSKEAKNSPAFVAAYVPVSEAWEASKDVAAAKAALPGVQAAATTPSDKGILGNLMYNVGVAGSDTALQLQGLEMMLDSGQLPAESMGQYNMGAAQLAYNAKDYAKARARAQAAIDAGYTRNDPAALLAEAYFADNMTAQGLAQLGSAIEARRAAGQEVPESWIKRGFSAAYQDELMDDTRRYARWYVMDYPSATSWGDAIAVERNFGDYDEAAVLDFMRLASRANALRNSRDYIDYINAADARRLPGEVVKVIDAGVAAGAIDTSDGFVSEANSTARARLSADRADLPELERDARAAGANAQLTTAAADVFLSYGQSAKAEELYTLALTKPGVETARALTRLGIAQADQGKFAQAQATFAKVEGTRAPMAKLWALYVQQEGGTTGVEGSGSQPASEILGDQ